MGIGKPRGSLLVSQPIYESLNQVALEKMNYEYSRPPSIVAKFKKSFGSLQLAVKM
jgi:hypothetical protein